MSRIIVFLALICIIGVVSAQEEIEYIIQSTTTSTTTTSTTYDNIVQNLPLYQEIKEKTTTTIWKICGSKFECTVEYDADIDGKKDCCTPNDNPICSSCFASCRMKCGEQNQGISKCFMGVENNSICECSGSPPTCYILKNEVTKKDPTTTTLTEDAVVDQSNILYYLLGIGLMVFVLYAAVNFVHKMD
ncbi:MAG: hypothetical protein KKD39_07505 [Candidatus Altiarchaeota archaeon]|nr:hypothetical protein [Candidatus Altiarchaeota archaeon]